MKPFDNSEYITIDNIIFHARCFEPPGKIHGKMLLVHGFGSHTYAWRKTIPALLKMGISCVCVDVPPWGYGHRSTLPNNQLTSLLWKLLCHLDAEKKYFSSLEKWYLCGHSMGGVVCINMAAANPEKVERLVLLNPAVKLPYPGLLMKIAKPFTTPVYRLLLAIKPLHLLITRRPYNGMISKEEMLDSSRPFFEQGVPFQLGNVYTEGFSPCLSGIENINYSTLIIWAEKDKVLGGKIPKCLISLKNTRLHLIKNCGHCAMETHSHEVNGLIESFINQKKD